MVKLYPLLTWTYCLVFTVCGTTMGLAERNLLFVAPVDGSELFTGIGYVLTRLNDSQIKLTWVKESQKFQYKKMRFEQPPIFFLTHFTAGYYYLWCSCFPSKKVVTKSITDDNGDYAILTLENTRISNSRTTRFSYRFERNTNNIHRLDMKGDTTAAFDLGNENQATATFRFEMQIELNYEIRSINASHPESKIPNHFPVSGAKLYRETIYNPSPISRVKTIERKEVTTNTKTYTLNEAFGPVSDAVEIKAGDPIITSGEITRKPDGSKEVILKTNAWKNTTGITETVTETITVPPFTCVELYLITDQDLRSEQDMDAHIRVSGKLTRASNKWEMLPRRIAPGFVVKEFLSQTRFKGMYLETTPTGVIYEVPGRIIADNGQRSTFISKQVKCNESSASSELSFHSL